MKVSRVTACLFFLAATVPAFAQDEALGLAKKKKAAELLGQQFSKSDIVSPLTSLQATVKGTFWRNPDWVSLLDLSADQQKKMDDIFHQYRLKLIDLTASLQKEELILEPYLAGTKPSPDIEAKVLTQIDRIADARANLEKANSRMLLSILQVLTPEQWSKLPMPPKKGLSGVAKPLR